jgi:predicted DNA-binding transcriptional regulator YafY
MGYAKRLGRRSERRVSPLGLVDKDDIWYLIAGTENGQRTFRVDRIAGAELTDEPAERPPDFDLSEAWQQVVDEVEQRRGGLSAMVLIEARFVHVLCTQFGRQCEELGEQDDGRARVRVSAPTPLMIAQQLAGWGALIELVDSPLVGAELARIGTELAERYSRERQ